MNHAISVIIPVYNVAPWLRECLDSVRAQTFTDWECICVDDGSTDSSPDILDEYAAKDKRFRIVRREHSNAGAARNIGMDLAQGEFLSFLDSDDVFSPWMFETMLESIERNNADIAACQYRSFKDGETIPAFPACEGKEIIYDHPARNTDIFRTWISWAWDKLFRSKFVRDNHIRFQEIPAWNDMLFVDSALALAQTVIATDSPLVLHRVHACSIMAKNSGKTYFSDSLLAFYDRFLSDNSYKNDNLDVCFRLAVLRNARFMIQGTKSVAEFESIYCSARVLALRFDVAAVPEKHFKKEKALLAFRSLLLDCETATDAVQQLLAEHIRFHCLKLSRLWKISQIVLLPVFLLHRLVLQIRNHFA